MYSLKTIPEYQMLNIDGVQSINNVLLKPFYERIIEERKNLFMYVYTDHSTQVIERVSNLSADIGFVCSVMRNNNVRFYLLFQEELLLLCRKDSEYYEGIHPLALDIRYEVRSLWSAEYENWHRQMFGVHDNSMVILRTGGSMVFDMFFRPEIWSIVSASTAEAIKKNSRYDLTTYRMSPAPPPLPCYKILPSGHQHHPEGLAIFEEELDRFVLELKKNEYYH